MEAVLKREDEKTVKFEAEPLLSFIVPIYNIKPDVLKRCLMSLDDQDYENLEVVCVFDGPNPELKEIADSFAKTGLSKFRVFEIPHGGACAARNYGFKKSTGDIVSFFNSDYVAKPGMARMWIDALQSNPDCGFVYGSYQYSSSNGMWYPSKSFDPFLLDVANYIDCGFPLWRKYVVDWDVNCKSLQDWDFWLRVIKTHKIKGHYLPTSDISFVAEPPRPKGLSDDSANNWIDRVTHVKKKNKIPLRDILVTSIGAQTHGIEIAKMIGADYRDDTLYKPCDYRVLYMIGFFMRPDNADNDHPRILSHFKDRYPQTKRIIHFVGADIYWLRKFPWDSLRYLAGALNLSVDHILCETKQAQAELKELGINADILPIPSYSDWDVAPLPKEFTVSVFLTERSDFDKYCFEHTLSIIRAMPDIQFTAYGDGGRNIRYPNLKHFGNMSREAWKEYVYRNSALLRLVRHDTLPMAGCEFLMAGRQVVTNISMDGAEWIDTRGKSELNQWDMFQEGLNTYNWPSTKKRIVQKIREMKDVPFNSMGWARYYQSLLNRDRYIETINGYARV